MNLADLYSESNFIISTGGQDDKCITCIEANDTKNSSDFNKFFSENYCYEPPVVEPEQNETTGTNETLPGTNETEGGNNETEPGTNETEPGTNET